MYGQLIVHRIDKSIQEKSLQQIVLGQLDSQRQKNEVKPLIHTIYEN